MKLHKKIYYCRKRAGLSQDALAEKLGISRQAISKWETGESVPETGKLAALAAALGVSIDWLLSEDGPDEERGNAGDDSGVFTGERRDYGSHTPDWIDSLPKHIQSLARRWGWLAGVYIALCGVPFVIVGAIASAVTRSMSSMMGDFGGLGWFGGWDTAITVDGVEVPVQGSSVTDPMSIFATAILLIGIVLIIAGVALAVFLKRRSTK